MTDPNDKMLEDTFAIASGVNTQPPDDLMARVLADAHAQMKTSYRPKRKGFWTQFSDILGGWPVLGGLVAAGVAGLWVGVAPPQMIETFTANLMGETVAVNFLTDAAIFETGDFIDG